MLQKTIILACALLPIVHAQSPVADAAARHDFTAVNTLLKQGAKVDTAQPDGTTALHWAAYWNNPDEVRALLKAGANPKAANRFGATPLSQAAEVGGAEVVDILLKAGVDANTLTTKDGETALMTAARGGHVQVVKLLLDKGADVNAKENYKGQTALMWASAGRHPEVVKLLLDHGADWKVVSVARETKMPKLSAASSVTPMARGGLTALHFAAREGDVQAGRILLDGGVDPNILDSDNTPSMTVAIMNKQYTFAKLLLDRGANPNLADVRGRTALYAAIDARDEDYSALPMRKGDDPLPSATFIQALLDKGADPNLALVKNLPGRSGMDAGDTTLDEGATPLMRAARAGDTEVLRMLVAKGADLKKQTRLGNDALLFAAGVGYRDKNTHGEESEALDAVRYLKGLGMDLNRTNTRGESTLHGAAGRGADTIVRYLIAQGVPVDEGNKQGLTPLDYALGKNVFGQLPVPHDSTVDEIRKSGGHEGKPLTAARNNKQ